MAYSFLAVQPPGVSLVCKAKLPGGFIFLDLRFQFEQPRDHQRDGAVAFEPVAHGARVNAERSSGFDLARLVEAVLDQQRSELHGCHGLPFPPS